MKKLWIMSAKEYYFDQRFMSMDVENMILLTNEHISLFNLANDEDNYYRKWRKWMKNKQEEQLEKQEKVSNTKRLRSMWMRQSEMKTRNTMMKMKQV